MFQSWKLFGQLHFVVEMFVQASNQSKLRHLESEGLLLLQPRVGPVSNFSKPLNFDYKWLELTQVKLEEFQRLEKILENF
jgi:hypothetical protein